MEGPSETGWGMGLLLSPALGQYADFAATFEPRLGDLIEFRDIMAPHLFLQITIAEMTSAHCFVIDLAVAYDDGGVSLDDPAQKMRLHGQQ
jgi:hypothetical protein